MKIRFADKEMLINHSVLFDGMDMSLGETFSGIIT